MRHKTRERRPVGTGGAHKTTGRVVAVSAPTIPPGTHASRELAAWAAAVEHLHSLGLPAAVPPLPAAWLRRRGVRADWVTAS